MHYVTDKHMKRFKVFSIQMISGIILTSFNILLYLNHLLYQ